jgi:hypothetical protein
MTLPALCQEKTLTRQYGDDGVRRGLILMEFQESGGQIDPNFLTILGTPTRCEAHGYSAAHLLQRISIMPSLFRKLPLLAVLVLSASLQPFVFAQTGTAALSGPFAFLLKGTLTTPGLASRATAAVGSFMADGQGNILSGEMDFTSAEQTIHALPITGTYTLNSDSGAGTLTLTSTMGTESFAIYTTGGGLPPYTSGSLIETDGGPVVSSGSFYQQSSRFFVVQELYGYWRVALTGETLVSEGTPSPIVVDGNFSFPVQNPPEIITTVTRRVGSGAPEILSVTLRADQSYDLGRMLLGVFPGASGSPLNFAAYIVDDLHILVISGDPPQVNPLISGIFTRDSLLTQ